MALIDSSIFGIPFEGYDYYQKGTGGMKGVVAKAITLFNQIGPDMDRACLATFLAESLFAPTILIQNYITLEEISDFEVRATIRYKGQTASGIFTFNNQYEMISFTTKDRAAAGNDGSFEYIPWSALCSDYQLSENGIKRAANECYENKSGYPYGVYINWPFTNKGNILYNDKKFVTLLYEANEDSFYDMSKISDAGNMAKAGIYRFLGDSERVVMMVDCENSDPYKLYATLNNLDQQALLDKISKIVLFDDVNTASAWSILEDFTEIPIEYILIERLKDNKSLVDIRLTASASREHYRDGVNDFILVSSDSDYWGLITELPEANFLAHSRSRGSPPFRHSSSPVP